MFLKIKVRWDNICEIAPVLFNVRFQPFKFRARFLNVLENDEVFPRLFEFLTDFDFIAESQLLTGVRALQCAVGQHVFAEQKRAGYITAATTKEDHKPAINSKNSNYILEE